MIDSELFNENGNGRRDGNDQISDDMFNGIIDIFDFPMEEVFIDGDIEQLHGESHPLDDLSALPCPFTGNSCNDLQTPCLLSDEHPQTEPIVIDTCSGNISLHGESSSDDKESLQQQNSTTYCAGKSESESITDRIAASEGYSNSMKGKQKRKKRKKLSQISEVKKERLQQQQHPSTIGRCMHCNVTKTPQWREGPNGPKTLCNACGVCYKRGSLFPEYRPASSPTFVSSLHTNSRRRVIEMRHKAGQATAVGATCPSPRPSSTTPPSNSRNKVIKMSNKDSKVIMKSSIKMSNKDSKIVMKSNKAGMARKSCNKVVEMRNKSILVGGTLYANARTDGKFTPAISIATSPSPSPSPSPSQSHRKVSEMRGNGRQEAGAAASRGGTTTPTFVASLHSNLHKKCSFQQPVSVSKCMHCEATESPLWRQGPGGPKSLCNACGIRYKSGRLFPEYHPAASPTFVPSVHSNSHKKVLEMRNHATAKQQLSPAAAAATDTVQAMPHPPQLLP